MKKADLAIICGGIAPFVTFACILLAVASYPEFSWTNNALSDLGIVPGVTMILFNGGLIIGGILFTLFAYGLFSFMRESLLGRTGAFVFALATISIICIGIFNEHFRPTHFIVSVALFTFMPISFFILTGAFWTNRQKSLSIFTLAVGLTAAAIWILEYTIWYVPHVAIPEFTSGLLGATWVLVIVNKMLKNHSKLSL